MIISFLLDEKRVLSWEENEAEVQAALSDEFFIKEKTQARVHKAYKNEETQESFTD